MFPGGGPPGGGLRKSMLSPETGYLAKLATRPFVLTEMHTHENTISRTIANPNELEPPNQAR